MVGRLIEHQQRWLLQEQLGQHDAHPPAARKQFERAVQVVGREAETFQNFFGFGLDRVPVERVEFLLHFAEFID